MPLTCELIRREPKRDDALDGGVEGTGDSPPSWRETVVGVVMEEQVFEEHMLGRDRSVAESPGLIRVSVSGMDADEKWPRTLGRHRHEEGRGAAGVWGA